MRYERDERYVVAHTPASQTFDKTAKLNGQKSVSGMCAVRARICRDLSSTRKDGRMCDSNLAQVLTIEPIAV